MNEQKWVTKYLSDSDVAEITAAVKKAELITSAEIVPMVVSSSTPSSFIFPYLALFLSFFLFTVLTITEMFAWALEFDLIGSVVAGIVLAWPLSTLAWIKRFMLSKFDQETSCARRAQLEFYLSGITKTAAGTGVLIFVSLLEHKVIILVDEAINNEFDSQIWDEQVTKLIDAIKRREMGSGMIELIKYFENLLGKRFPVSKNDINELPDDLLIKH